MIIIHKLDGLTETWLDQSGSKELINGIIVLFFTMIH